MRKPRAASAWRGKTAAKSGKVRAAARARRRKTVVSPAETYRVFRAITGLVLFGNARKTAKLRAVLDEAMWLTAVYARHMVGLAVHPEGWGKAPLGPNSFNARQVTLPPVHSALSARWRQECWRRACGQVDSWLANGRHLDGSDEPSFDAVAIDCSVKVARLQPGREGGIFERWLQVSTLVRNDVIDLPFEVHRYGQDVIADALSKGGRIHSDVLLREHGGQIHVQLCVSHEVTRVAHQGTRGHDAGVVTAVTDSDGNAYGGIRERLTRRVALASEKGARKRRLNACRKRKGLPPVPLRDGKIERWVRNEVGRAANLCVAGLLALPVPPLSVLENLDVASMRFKSRAGNRRLRAAQLGYLCRHLRRRMDVAGLPWAEVQAAYGSRQCNECQFTFAANRPSQAVFACLACGHEDNADRNNRDRHGDAELNGLHDYRQVGAPLAARYLPRVDAPLLPRAEGRTGLTARRFDLTEMRARRDGTKKVTETPLEDVASAA